MTRSRKMLLSTVSAVALTVSSSVYAADLNPGGEADPGFDMAAIWSGFYLGGFAGYGRSHFDYATESAGPFSSETNGGLAGLLVGYNFQVQNIVFGIEADIAATPWKSDLFSVTAKSTAQGRFTGLASVRGRLGYAFDRSLVFGTVGVGEVEGSFVDTKNKIISDFQHSGLVFGGGIEHKLTDRVNVGVDALMFQVGETQTRLSATGKKSSTFGPDDVGVVRARLNIQF
jgi:outer membrane immunogenic protein